MKRKDLIQRSDNTRVDIGTPELPKWEVPFVPDYYEGEREYKNGNYTNPHAKAYAEKISGRIESVSPEFELLSGLGLKQIWKFTNNLFKKTPKLNLYPNHLELTKERLRNGGFDRLERQAQIAKNQESGFFVKKENYNNFSPESRQQLLDMMPDSPNTSKFYDKSPNNVAVANQRLGYFSDVFTDAPKHYQTPLAKSSLNSHEFSHVVYQPNWGNRPPEGSYDLTKLAGKTHYLGIPRSGGLAEQTARGTQLKNILGLKEGEDITPEMWNYVKKNLDKLGFDNNLSNWMNAVTNVPAYLKWLNKNSPVLVTPIIGLYNEKDSKK